MSLSREIEIKLCQNFTKTYIYEISYKIRSIKQSIFNNYGTNMKMTISHRSRRISDMLFLYILNFYCTFLIDRIDNIITYSLYTIFSFVTKNREFWFFFVCLIFLTSKSFKVTVATNFIFTIFQTKLKIIFLEMFEELQVFLGKNYTNGQF